MDADDDLDLTDLEALVLGLLDQEGIVVEDDEEHDGEEP